MKIIADNLSVTKSTVSRALNDDSQISSEMKRKIKKMAQEMGYKKPKQNLRRVIGIVVLDAASPFCSQIIRGAEDMAKSSGYNVIVKSTDALHQDEVKVVSDLQEKGVSGIILQPFHLENKHITEMHNNQFPFVLIDRRIDEIKCDYVVSNNFQGAYDLVTYLIKLGCRKIAHVTRYVQCSTAKERLDGYNKALLDNDIEPCEDLITVCDDYGEECGRKGMKILLNRGHPFDSVFAVSNVVTAGIINYLKDRKPELLNKIMIAEFDSPWGDSYWGIPLPSAIQRTYEMGHVAAEILIKKIQRGKNVDVKQVTLDTHLVVQIPVENEAEFNLNSRIGRFKISPLYWKQYSGEIST